MRKGERSRTFIDKLIKKSSTKILINDEKFSDN
jgi:hypothetical protein